MAALPEPEEPAHEERAPSLLVPELAAELPVFEQFFKTFGFKRLHGRVWGLLVLCEGPLSSKEICEQLGISQGAASTTLHELTEWGAVQCNFDPARRCHLHAPVGNALSIAATILRRREQVAFQQFRATADRAMDFIRTRHGDRDPRVLTLRSIIAACEIAEALMKLLVTAVANALGDSQSILSRAITAALKVGLGAPQTLFAGPGQRVDPSPAGELAEAQSANAKGRSARRRPAARRGAALAEPEGAQETGPDQQSLPDPRGRPR